jgi:hypothetical protein
MQKDEKHSPHKGIRNNDKRPNDTVLQKTPRTKATQRLTDLGNQELHRNADACSVITIKRRITIKKWRGWTKECLNCRKRL